LNHPSARRVEKAYVRYRTLLIEVVPGDTDSYAQWARQKRFVISATPEFFFRFNSLHPTQVYLDCRMPRLLGLVGPLAPAGSGLGVTIGVLDTGLASHPCSPALTLHEYRSSDFLWNDLDKLHQTNAALAMRARQNLWSQRASLQSAMDRVADFELRNPRLWDTAMPIGSAIASAWATEIEGALGVDERAILSMIHESSFNFVDQNLDVSDRSGHGTAVATIAAGRDTALRSRHIKWFSGIAPDARIAVYKVAERETDQVRSSVIADALEVALASPDLDVLCLALDTNLNPPQGFLISQQLHDLRVNNDVLILASAGNAGTVGLGYPARLPEVCAIGSVSRNLTRSPFSNQADVALGETCDFCFFGGDALTADLRDDFRSDRIFAVPDHQEGFRGAWGTSVACAAATGVAAVLISRHRQNLPRRIARRPRISDAIYAQLARGANKLPLQGMTPPHSEFGHGIITAI
jgi:subtilisin family serine protease